MRPSQRPALRSHLTQGLLHVLDALDELLVLRPYLSQTGFTASWNGFLSAILMTSTPFALMSASAFSSISYQSLRCSCCASLASFSR